ncbi:procollagen-lysine,2-oxoglutarate 5-dioxygenase 3 [Trichinella spiralis]|uniref:procollagen-lysine,2-oxoglutarate 5-dioxygenase 3 n=1 Tax=Trichinella spiralis TaxID=6334 RepID=UPI0001EFB3FF|nr:procollagen-lysine,2-oxoglutarate 5-dioxygenase 3 [Trichinella spiralis]
MRNSTVFNLENYPVQFGDQFIPLCSSILAVRVLVWYVISQAVKHFIFRSCSFWIRFPQGGKTVLVTGASAGIGAATAEDLCARGGKVIWGARDVRKAQKKLDDIAWTIHHGPRGYVLKIDLSSKKMIEDFVDEFKKREKRLDCLILNAAYWGPKRTTVDGFEETVGVNHLGHMYLVYLLMDLLKKSTPSRIIVLGSDIHRLCKGVQFDDFMSDNGYKQYKSYAHSKLCNMLFARELAHRLKGTGVTVHIVHPGTPVPSELMRHNWLSMVVFHTFIIRPLQHLFCRTVYQGSQTTVEYPVVKSGKRYLNSGAFIGYAPDIYKIITERSLRDDDDDQLYYTHIFLDPALREKHKIKLDSTSAIFQNLHGAVDDVDLDFSPSGHRMRQVRLANLAYGTEPVIIHGNGKSKMHLNYLGNYIGNWWNPTDGCVACNDDLLELNSDNENDFPFVVLACFINSGTPFLDKYFESILRLDYPKSRIGIVIFNRPHAVKVEHFVNLMDGEYHFVQADSAISLTERNARDRAVSLIAPMMIRGEALWSNFWGALNDDGFYARSDDYISIAKRERLGLWNIPHFSTAYLIRKDRLSLLLSAYSYNGKNDPDMSFTQFCREKEWEERYLDEKYWDTLSNDYEFELPCPDVYHFPLFSKQFCKEMIAVMENYGRWSSGSNLPPHAIMNFVVRYKPDEQPALRPHHDASTYTVDIALNKAGEDFEVQMSRVGRDVNYPFEARRTFRQIRRLIELAKEMESDGLERIDFLGNLLMQRQSVEEVDLDGSPLASLPEFQTTLMAEIDMEVTSVFANLMEMVIHCQNVCAELERDLNTANWHSENQVEKSARLATPFWPAVDQLQMWASEIVVMYSADLHRRKSDLDVLFVDTLTPLTKVTQLKQNWKQPAWFEQKCNHIMACVHYLINAMIEDLDGPQEQLAHSDVITVERERLDTPDQQNFKCRFCGLVYNYLSTLKAHERVHDVEEPYVCAKCGLSFRFYSELQTHSEEHKGTYTYKCGCGRSFAKYTDLLYHKHDSDDEDEPTEETVLAEKKPAYQGKYYPDPRNAYYCQFCCRGYKTSHELKYHLYSHRGERAFTVGSSRYLMNRM